MEQNALTVIVPIKPRELQALTQVLTTIGQDIQNNPDVRFAQSPSTHFARWVILNNDKKRGPRLFFSSSHDGSFESYMEELVTAFGPGMEQIWEKCEGYDSGTAQDVRRFTDFIRRHSHQSAAFYIAYRGLSVQQIRNSSQIRRTLDELLDNPGTGPWLGKLMTLLPPVPQTDTPPPTDSAASVQPELSAPARLLEWLVGVRHTGSNPNSSVTATEEMVNIEDVVVQNQMTVIVPIKSNPLSQLLVRVVLAAVNAKAKGTTGSLAGLTTIHFARWVIIDNGKNLLFESNYDGSWENYIDDFVDYSSLGMNAIWANCKKFPIHGCRDIDGFKAYIRDNQIPAQVFYSAYPKTTVKNVLHNLHISRSVEQFVRREEVDRFLKGSYRGSTPDAVAELFQESRDEPRKQGKSSSIFLTLCPLLLLVGFLIALVFRSSRTD